VAFSDFSYGVVDCKTSLARPEHTACYSRQLHAYAYALEHPAAGRFALAPISRPGLLCVEPVAKHAPEARRFAYLGDATWLECPKDYDKFLAFLDRVLSQLEQPSPPAGAPTCG
jgi:hypothetical protein